MIYVCYERGFSTLLLEEGDRVAQVEFISHTDFIARVSGLDPLKQPEEALKRVYDRLDLDMVWFTYDPLHPWDWVRRRGDSFTPRADSWSKAFPTTWRETFSVNSVEEVLEFDPFEAWEVPSVSELAEHFEEVHGRVQRFYENQVVPGGSYLTCFMWLVLTFGLRWTTKVAYRDPKRFKRLLNRFGQLSLIQFKAWAKTGIKAFISHDDICSTRAPFFPPHWLRENLFPWYEKLWSELRSKGIVVLFCTDGDVTLIIDDLASLGAGGFIVEECCNLEYIAGSYGNEEVIVGGVDVGKLTYGSTEDVVNEVKRCLRVAGPYPGYLINVSGSIPDNIPLENLETYFKACGRYGRRIRAHPLAYACR